MPAWKGVRILLTGYLGYVLALESRLLADGGAQRGCPEEDVARTCSLGPRLVSICMKSRGPKEQVRATPAGFLDWLGGFPFNGGQQALENRGGTQNVDEK